MKLLWDDLLKVILTSLSMNMTIVIQNMGTGWHCMLVPISLLYHCYLLYIFNHHKNKLLLPLSLPCYYNKIFATSVITIYQFCHYHNHVDYSSHIIVAIVWLTCIHFNYAGCSFPSEVVAAMEINTTANQVYHLNFSDTNLLQKNIEVSGLKFY